MKVLTILGTRPEIIRLSLIIKKLDLLCDHRVLHTGQNFDKSLNDIFFDDLNLRKPNVYLNSKGSIAEQMSTMFLGIEEEIKNNRPDKVLILGDTNSGLCAIVCERLGIPVYHMEAGNRCFDNRVPEEINRKIIDHTCSFNLPYTPGARENLLNEGLSKNKIFTCGNPIYEVLNVFKPSSSNIDEVREKFKINELFNKNDGFFLATIHRSENVDNESTLRGIISGISKIRHKTILSCHPKTKQRIKDFKIETNNIKLIDPVNFKDFLSLENLCDGIITDSGTVMEEACILNIPCLVARESTERPEIFEKGFAILCGTREENIIKSYNMVSNKIKLPRTNTQKPEGYENLNVSDLVVNFIFGEGI